MSNTVTPKLSKWPFLLGDLLLVGFASFLIFRSPVPLNLWEGILSLVATVAGAWLSVVPFLREYQAALKLRETDDLATTVAQIGKLEEIRNHIVNATDQWQTVQEQSKQTMLAAKDVTERVKTDVSELCAFLQKAHDAEKNQLRVEVEKLRRGEGEWLQVTVHILDHVFALHKAGSRSGSPGLLAQLNQFQFACRDIVRRVGLVAFAPAPGDLFDKRVHQLEDGQTNPDADTRVGEILAPGFTCQAQLVRRALVRLEPRNAESANATASAAVQLENANAGNPNQSQAAPPPDSQNEFSP